MLSKLPRCVGVFIFSWSFAAFLMDVFLLYKYQNILDEAVIQVLLDTNMPESLEFLKINAVSIAGLLIVAAICSIVLLQVLRRDKHLILAQKRILAYIVLLSVECFFLVLLNSNWFDAQPFQSSLLRMSRNIYLSLDEIQRYQAIYRHFDESGIELIRNDADLPYVVFILGESTSKNHMGIYGYPINNTPLMEEREKKGELQVFSDVVSPQSETILVVERLFTFYRNGEADDWYNYTNLFDVLRKAGYHTSWLSNQESAGICGGVTSCYADRCAEKRFLQIRGSDSHAGRLDEQLLPVLDESLNAAYEKNFYVLHTMGTHFDYAERYPAEYNVFKVSDETGRNETERQKRAEYDNAVLYNDFILNEVIKRFEDKDAIIIYVSDHGEEVYERRNCCGHYRIGSFYQIEIPMFVWTSERFRANHIDSVRKIVKAKDKPFMTDDMIHAILDLMQVETTEYDSSKSIFNDNFAEQRERIYNDKIYKKDWRLKNQ